MSTPSELLKYVYVAPMKVGLLALALTVSAGCRSAVRTSVASGDNEVRRVSSEAATRATAASARAAMRGDWILRDRDLRVTVTGTDGPVRNEPPGTIAQLSLLSLPGVEAVRTVEPLLRSLSAELPLRDVRFEAVLERGTAVLRMRARARVGAVTLEVTRDYWLETGRKALHLRTRIRNAGAVAVRGLAWGARVQWGGSVPFAPRMGAVAGARDGSSHWVGHAMRGAAAAWTRTSGTREMALCFSAHEHIGAMVGGHTDALSPPVDLGPGALVEDRAMLLVAPGDLTDIARAVAYARNERIAEARLVLRGRAREPSVTITDATGAPVLVAEPTGRSVMLPLPPGDYVAHATAPGHAPADAVRFTVTPDSAGAVPVVVSIPPGGHIRVAALAADTMAEIPVRVTVRGVAPTLDPNLGPGYRAAGAGVIAIASDGYTEIPVPPGRYNVTVSHGPEWSIATQEVTVTENLRGDVSATLRHEVPMPEWVGCDLHVHANPSFDSLVTIEDRVASLVAEGVEFATPTEHNVVGDYSAGVAILPERIAAGFQWVPAVEVTTDRSAQPWGHFNVYPYRPDPNTPGGSPPPFLNVPPRQIFRAARANNPDAIIQVNHPRMQPNIGYFNVTGLDPRNNRAVSRDYDPGFDAIEVFNGFYINHIELVEGVLRDWMSLLATGARYIGTGSSDSHQVAFQWAGYPRTYVHVSGARDTAGILRALRGGRAFATSGPMLFLTVARGGDVAEPGDVVQVTPQEAVSVHVRVLAASWMAVDAVDVYRDGERVATLTARATTEAVRVDADVTLPMSPGSFLVAVARGPRGGLNPVLPLSDGVPWAFTNPVYFEARGR